MEKMPKILHDKVLDRCICGCKLVIRTEFKSACGEAADLGVTLEPMEAIRLTDTEDKHLCSAANGSSRWRKLTAISGHRDGADGDGLPPGGGEDEEANDAALAACLTAAIRSQRRSGGNRPSRSVNNCRDDGGISTDDSVRERLCSKNLCLTCGNADH